MTAGSASSGSAAATGAQVQNTVDLRSSAAVRVQGNNYNPIQIILNLAANLVNWGAGLASSGDAQSTANGPGSATSGGASAVGLQVLNLVTMWASATVDIEGNNYAPIVVEIHFKTNIDNRGVAIANSGNVAAGAPGAPGANSANSANSAPASAAATAPGTPNQPIQARGGNAVAIANSVNASITSAQMSSANGSRPLTTNTMTEMLRSLPPGSWTPFVAQHVSDTQAPAVQAGLSSTSGDSTTLGLQSTINQTNAQLVACSDPTVTCVARNTASLSVTARDLPTNPATRDDQNHTGRGPGGTTAAAGAAFVNVTPTPKPSPAALASASGGASSSHRSAVPSTRFASQIVADDLAAVGHVVLVDLWSTWPGRRLPPMPNPLDRQPSITHVGASLDGWPGTDELPLPDLSVSVAAAPQQAAPAHPRFITKPQGGSASHDLSAQLDDDESIALLAVYNVDPWNHWPNLTVPPMPGQTVPAVAATVIDQPAATDDESPPMDPGVAPTDLATAALLSILGAVGLGIRRARGWRLLSAIAAGRIRTAPVRLSVLLHYTFGLFHLR